MSRIITAILLVGSLAAVAAGCGSKSTSSSTPGTSAPPQTTSTSGAQVKAPGAKVSFVAPKSGAVVSGTVVAKVKITGFKIDATQVGKAAKQGVGHLHFTMDEGKFDFPKYSGPNGALAVKLGVQGKYSPSVAPTIAYKGLPKGKHKLEVYLANNDHTNTGVEAATSFTVK